MARRIPVRPVRSWSTTANLWDAAGAGRSLRVRLFSFEHFRTRADVILCFSLETFEPKGAGTSTPAPSSSTSLRHAYEKSRPRRVDEGGMIRRASLSRFIRETVQVLKGCSARAAPVNADISKK